MSLNLQLDSVALNTVLENLSTMLIICNTNAEIVYVNGKIEKFLNTNKEEVLLKKFGNAFKCLYDSEFGCGNSEHCNSICGVRKTLVAAITSNTPQRNSDIQLHLKSGDKIFFNVNAIPYQNDGTTFVVVMLENVKDKMTYELNIEKSAKLMAMKETGGAIAHELNNPLAIAIAQCMFIQKDQNNNKEKTLERVEKISNQLDKMAAIIHQIDSIVDYKIKQYTDKVNIADLTPKK
jgi:nitrogen-specific signal transduction histidine kinase